MGDRDAREMVTFQSFAVPEVENGKVVGVFVFFCFGGGQAK